MNRVKLMIILIFLISFCTTLSAQNYTIEKNHPKYAKMEANLIKGLRSDVKGLQFTSAYALGEMKSENAINPLIDMLRSHKDEDYRILAALSLAKIRTTRAKFMVRRVGEFVKNPKISHFCKKFLQVKKVELPKADEKLVTDLFKKK